MLPGSGFGYLSTCFLMVLVVGLSFDDGFFTEFFFGGDLAAGLLENNSRTFDVKLLQIISNHLILIRLTNLT